jgi:hypothetical protein
MKGIRIASVWIEDLQQWVPLSQIIVIQRYTHEGKSCIQFKYEKKILESYVEYKEI